ncbi:MAG: HAD-IIB family hydrolase [Candidatus Limnocylindrales bacterium]
MGTQRVVVADLDGTLLGDAGALDRFAEWHRADGSNHLLVYATGRSMASLRASIAETALPEPDASITGVGSEIYDRHGRPWPGWLARFEHWDAQAVRAALAQFRWLDLQPEAAQTRLKTSYLVAGLAPADRTSIEQALRQAGLVASISYSERRYLDVLPAGAGKGHAARCVVESWGLRPGVVMVFGDSGNDLQMFEMGYSGTVVANAEPELIAALGPSVYRSALAYADGVLDGIRHWTAD